MTNYWKNENLKKLIFWMSVLSILTHNMPECHKQTNKSHLHISEEYNLSEIYGYDPPRGGSGGFHGTS